MSRAAIFLNKYLWTKHSYDLTDEPHILYQFVPPGSIILSIPCNLFVILYDFFDLAVSLVEPHVFFRIPFLSCCYVFPSVATNSICFLLNQADNCDPTFNESHAPDINRHMGVQITNFTRNQALKAELNGSSYNIPMLQRWLMFASLKSLCKSQNIVPWRFTKRTNHSAFRSFPGAVENIAFQHFATCGCATFHLVLIWTLYLIMTGASARGSKIFFNCRICSSINIWDGSYIQQLAFEAISGKPGCLVLRPSSTFGKHADFLSFFVIQMFCSEKRTRVHHRSKTRAWKTFSIYFVRKV